MIRNFDFGEIASWLIIALIWIIVISFVCFAVYSIVKNEGNRIDAGIIVDRDFTRGYTSYSSDKNGGHMHSYPDTYTFTIEGEKDGKTVRYSFEVTEQEYNSYKIGDYYER